MVNNSTVNVLGSMIALVFLAGCLGNNPEPVEITTKPVDKPELSLPRSDELQLKAVNWQVVTPENIDQVFAEITESGRPATMFALTDRGYENLGLNLSDLRAYIQQQQVIIAAYENYYQRAEETLDNAVVLD